MKYGVKKMDEGLGKKLKKLRTAKGMTQDMVAKILHTTRQRYARMENGQADIPFQDIRMLAEVFGISTSDLTAEDQKEKIRGIIAHQKPELLQRNGMEQLMCLLDALEEQERIYQRMKDGQGAGNDACGKAMYGILQQVQRPAMGWMSGNRLLHLLEHAGLELFRFPFDEPELLGFLVFNGVGYTMVTNTDYPAAEEMKAAAFLAGIHFTRETEQRQFLYVLERQQEPELLQKERKAAEFAGELLIPGYELHNFIRYELQIPSSQLRAIHVVMIQSHFQVSYETAENALLRERLISGEQVKKIHKGRRYYGEKRMADMLGINVDFLYVSAKQVSVPHRYVEHLLSNFENGYVPFIQLEQTMKLMQVSVRELAGLRKPQDDRDNWDDNWDEGWT